MLHSYPSHRDIPDTMAESIDLPPPPPPDILDTVPPPPPSSDVPPPPPTSDVPPPPPSDAAPNGSLEPTNKKRKLGWASKTQPLSIEELLAKKKAENDAAAKPKFLSKKERERIALERRQKEVEELKKREEINGRASAGTASGKVNGQKSLPTGPKSAHRDRDDIPTGPASMRHLPSQGYDMGPPPPPKAKPVADGTQSAKNSVADVEAEMIRQRYMGADTNMSTFSAKKKRKRTSDKKFNFEWNAEEDTSPDYNPIYAARTTTNFFGRGHLGGYADDTSDLARRDYAHAILERDPIMGKQRVEQLMEWERRRPDMGRMNVFHKHWSIKNLDDMQERDWRILKDEYEISTKGGNVPNPMRNWSESGLPQRLLDLIQREGYTEPTPIQRAAIPIALQNRDLLAVAKTGSGKTMAFLLPLLVYISELPAFNETSKNDGPYAVILAPTRELAQQIEVEAKKFATPLGFTCVSLVGGHAIEEQSYNMRDGAEIIIATPGRLVDCIERRVLVLNQCCYVVLDEADKMIDRGFEVPLNKILDALPVSNEKPDTEEAEDAAKMAATLTGQGHYRQTMMFTATMPPAVERIAQKYLRRPATAIHGTSGEAVDTVEQRVEFITGEEKRKKRINEILNSHEFAPPVFIFVNMKQNCDAVAREIQRMGFNVVTFHGSKSQDQREAALNSLRERKSDVLVGTDLAGRGIDVPDVSLVINFNMAPNIEAYQHRIGRTGRAGKTGVAITFLGNEDSDVLYDLKQMISKSSISRVPEELRKHEAAQQRGGKHRKGGGTDESGGFGGRGG